MLIYIKMEFLYHLVVLDTYDLLFLQYVFLTLNSITVNSMTLFYFL